MTFRSFTPKEPYEWRDAREHSLSVVVWYPTDANARVKPLVIRGLDIFDLGKVVQDAPLATKKSKFPLVVISHGTGGSALSMAWLGEALAAQGYVAAAVNHPGNNAADSTARRFSLWWERARDLSQTDVLEHSGNSFRDARVRAVFAMAPGLGPAISTPSLEAISIPVEIVAGESDRNVPIELNAKYLAAQISGAKLHIFPGGVARYVFLDSCTEVGRKNVPMLCVDKEGVDRDAIHADTVQRALQFYRVTLRPESG